MGAALRRLLRPAVPARAAPAAVRRGALAALGLGCGVSPAFYGYFGMTTWGPIALLLLAAAIGLLLSRPPAPGPPVAVAVAALALFAAWSLLSMGWAESADRALTEGDRWALYAVFVLVAVLLVREREDGEAFLAAAAAGVLGIAAYDLITMLGDEGPSLFGGSRLLEPLGYVNGLGGFFLLGFWPLAAVAERARTHALAGLAAAAATALAALVLLTESRGTAFALAASSAVVLALLPGRTRRGWLLLAVLVALAVAWDPLTDVTRGGSSDALLPSEGATARAAESILLVSVAVGLLWGLASWLAAAARDGSAAAAAWLPRAAAVLLCGIALGAAGSLALAVDDPVGRLSDQYEAFTDLETSEEGSRFTSGGGNRYDYWRIAWEQFADHPLKGIGAGNFTRTYFLERRTNEDVRQAHSIELQTLGDTGLIGALALGAFLLAVFFGLWRRAAAARRTGAEVGLTIAAAGVFVVWLAQTSVDWLHLIPGLTGIALGAAAILLRPAADEPERAQPRAVTGEAPPPGEAAAEQEGPRALPPLATGALLLLALAAIVLIGRPTLAEHLRGEAQGQLDARPLEAISSAEESLSLNPEAVETYYVKAAAEARLGAYEPARSTLLEAIAREPHNYVSWTLLGDLATRRGDLAAAQRAYLRASRLNPRDRELQRLAERRGLLRQLHRDPDRSPALLEASG